MEISEKRGAASHLGRTRMRGYDLPTVIKLLEIHRGVPHHRMLRTRERDRPPGEGQSDSYRMPVILPEEQIPAGGAPGLIRDMGCEPEMSRR